LAPVDRSGREIFTSSGSCPIDFILCAFVFKINEPLI
jgi:hypothetical protein